MATMDRANRIRCALDGGFRQFRRVAVASRFAGDGTGADEARNRMLLQAAKILETGIDQR